ncbi:MULTISPECIES: hypothetical protein [Pseudomonas]|jgi:hypothetical protein|uniref:Prophage PSSB64-02 n=1 Tax=Pseudomonas juntendi TaxID=2666183 RepID=A0A7W2KD45_9PSED|nr:MULTISPECIES: hypothetical protein [Pseudomonas]NOY02624.1 hypothetical protein [Gammaproteobacteria bacterium]MBA6061532.1 hypothetical protein [Pseudomonas juntendi]MBA6096317.1 hypothetical protein [Pseudomonas juntendi]MBR7522084.1 hypothetical protein [Pseudomonas juntendi]MDH0757687.1 hypothetical protein [Pseudomonas juntendi]
MYFLLVRRRVDGVAIPTNRLSKITPIRADIHIGDQHSEPLGRVSTQAWVFNPSPGPDIIPRLHDAKVNGMAQLGININGVEEVDGVLYAQSWWCRAE